MPKRLCILALLAVLSGLVVGCAHRPDPASPAPTGLVFSLSAGQIDPDRRSAEPFATPASAPSRVYRGQDVFIAAPSSEIDHRLELEIRKPGFFRLPARVSATGRVIRFQTDARDPLGDYTLILRLHDTASGRTRTVRRALRVEAYRPPLLAPDFDARNWLVHYYRQPTPELALPALGKLHFSLPADKRPGALPALLGFYDQLLRDNPWLLPAFSTRLASADPNEAYLLSLVLAFHFRRADGTRPAALDEAAWTRLADFRGHDWPADPDAPLAELAQLDALWGRFFAAGRYTDLQILLHPLTHHADLGAAETWQRRTRAAPSAASDLADPLADAPPEVRRDVLLRSALWSLGSNARQHPLVRAYLERSLAAPDLAPETRALIRRILDTAAASP